MPLPPESPEFRPAPSARGPALALFLLALVPACGGGDESSSGTSAPGPKPAQGPSGAGAKGEAKGGGNKGEASAKLALTTGRQLLLKGEPDKAADEFRRATELDPKLSEAHFELGKLLLHLSSQTIGSQARDLEVLERGIASMQQACDLAPSNAYFWYWLARGKFQQDKAQTAGPIELLQKALALDPEMGTAWKLLGRVQVQAGDFEAARESLTKATELMPRDGNSRFHLGTTLEVLGKPEEAKAVYEDSIQKDPSNAKVYESLIKVCVRLGDAEGEARANAGLEAWGEYQKKLNYRRTMVNQHPDDPQWVRRLGQSYFEVGKWDEALEWFMKAIHLDPKDGLAHLYCGVARRNLEDYDNALNHLKEAEFLAPDILDPKLELLRLYAAMRDDKALGETLTKIEEEAAEDGASLFSLAEVAQELGRGDDATRLFGKAAALGVTSAPEPAADAPEDG